MDKQKVDGLVAYANLRAPVRLILGYRSTDQNVSLGRVAVAEDVQGMFAEIAESVLEDRKRRDPESWSPGRPVSPETYLVTTCLDVGDVPQVSRSQVQPLLSALIHTDQIVEMDGSNLRRTDPYFYAFQFGTGAKSITFLRKLNPLRGLRKRRLALLDDEMTLVNHHVFAFDGFADMIVTQTHLLIFNQTAFAAIFRGQAELEKMAKGWVEGFSKSMAITQDSFDLLMAKVKTDSRITNRIENIQRRGHLASLTTKDLRRGMKRCDLDEKKLINTSGELVFTEQNLAEVLKFLNEDMFRGVLTDEPFESDSKAPRH
ncbi:hypothetical protein CGZ98_07720 [Enemella evansiae]|nr:Kiwa anti-phage protein KwaB-like domain-containing protein [Enemella evansiae]OYO12069.1 hypothetical protein CGZ98_07720 [Enemella evansiae]